MLYRVIIGNYKSFAQEQEFNMFPNMRRDNFTHHIYGVDALPVLKETAIYGANGSGKSNFIKALDFVRRFTTSGTNVDKTWLKNWYVQNRFRLPVMNGDKTSDILLEFGISDSVYIYTLGINNEGVKTENLYLSGKGKEESISIFTRSYNHVEFQAANVGEEVRKIFERQITDNPSLSVLSLNGSLHLSDDENMRIAYNWFKDNLSIISINRQIPWLIEQLKKQSDVMEFVNKVFSEIGLGIQHMEITSSPLDKWLEKTTDEDKSIITSLISTGAINADQSVSKMGGEVPMYSLSEENGERMIRELIFTQIGQDGYVGNMDISSQSSGTLRLLTLVPALYQAIHTDSTIIVDEIDNGMHPLLIKRLVKFFGDSTTKGQLIFTTHETPLLNQQELLRADEVWFTEKKSGETLMYSLNEFKYHKTLSIENGYLQGRFGAIPFLGSLK